MGRSLQFFRPPSFCLVKHTIFMLIERVLATAADLSRVITFFEPVNIAYFQLTGVPRNIVQRSSIFIVFVI